MSPTPSEIPLTPSTGRNLEARGGSDCSALKAAERGQAPCPAMPPFPFLCQLWENSRHAICVSYHCVMSDIESPAVAADQGEPRPTTVSQDKYTLSIDDAIERYKGAGIPRTRRTVQRYCSNKTLDAHAFAIPYGEKYFITPESLERHIAYILEGEAAMADHGETRRDAALGAPETSEVVTLSEHVQFEDRNAGSVVKGADIIAMLREETTFLKDQITVKDEQLAVKDRQIADQSERVRETNLLVASLHKLITPLIDRGTLFNARPGSGADDIHSHQQ
jgi:hypothetical protein